MANMSYCRMENTFNDLSDCYQNWDYPEETESESELKYRENILKLCKRIIAAFDEDDEDENDEN
ncbi:MAG: hypothetical protein ABI091_26910 [Ferruginibacter sp.]